ncbi:hypothetical protein ALT_0638 [Aspergillus lentulus]|uniref:Uncharacterized protein n=1 Tax=Aspergillus lentulus TaxID=293939 RepID=A0AAN4T702_ASPLE|nr:hypothetical protein CNMCM6936_007847 [Aspergillus lentulus]GAQ03317.1 hypothetical protein ALT_0638 [Aspergillus lentulus]
MKERAERETRITQDLADTNAPSTSARIPQQPTPSVRSEVAALAEAGILGHLRRYKRAVVTAARCPFVVHQSNHVSAVEVYTAVAADVDSRDLRNMADLAEEGLEEVQAKRSRDEAGDRDGDDDERYNIYQKQLADIHDAREREDGDIRKKEEDYEGCADDHSKGNPAAPAIPGAVVASTSPTIVITKRQGSPWWLENLFDSRPGVDDVDQAVDGELLQPSDTGGRRSYKEECESNMLDGSDKKVLREVFRELKAATKRVGDGEWANGPGNYGDAPPIGLGVKAVAVPWLRA